MFLNYLKQKDVKGKTLLLLTTSSPTGMDFPNSGKAVLYRKPLLMGSVLATGARTENSCGIYEEAEIFKRILEGPRGVQQRKW
ncbi:MAG: hypothetical protein HQK53_15345 [Oligoflexia bacterium]|nr:hypothetical protein [Oligoflexia bacterium]